MKKKKIWFFYTNISEDILERYLFDPFKLDRGMLADFILGMPCHISLSKNSHGSTIWRCQEYNYLHLQAFLGKIDQDNLSVKQNHNFIKLCSHENSNEDER